MQRNIIELLAPAKTKGHAFAAINSGADAIYIGGPSFSARSLASNSFCDIAEVVSFAHLFGAKVYVALNTILTDSELQQAIDIIKKLYDIGVDALITQDFALVSLMHKGELPPIPLHASTQMNNRDVEKVQFLESLGFEQVVLARESSLQTIAEIAQKTNVKIECFIHGALCVSYSGQCYLSEKLMGRSANRGECAQPCRLPYTLKDANGKIIAKDKHLLSLKDFCAEPYLEKLILAGVSSFKIEGRLKDANYVKNVTSYYNNLLNNFIAKHPEYRRASEGFVSKQTFTPCLEKSFNRGFTSLFLSRKREEIASFDSPKSKGEFIGKCASSRKNIITIDTEKKLHNGDGFTFTDNAGSPQGFRADVADQNNIYVSQGINITVGTPIYRNFDKVFEDGMSKDNSLRLLPVSFFVKDQDGKILFKVTYKARENEYSAAYTIINEFDEAQNPSMAVQNIEKTLRKTGGTNFVVETVECSFTKVPFIPNSILSAVKRELLDLISKKLCRRPRNSFAKPDNIYIPENLPTDYRANIHNSEAKRFYEAIVKTEVQNSYESEKSENIELMRCHHCLRYSLGICKKTDPNNGFKEPFVLVTPMNQSLQIEFDCKNCEMIVRG